MKTYNIEIVERLVYEFQISAETEEEARDIIQNSWKVYDQENTEVLRDSQFEIFTFESRS